MGTVPWYCTREEVAKATDAMSTAYKNTDIDNAIEDASRTIEGPSICNRKFYPQTATRYKDWPDTRTPTSWRLWLDADELVSVSTLISGGTTIAAADYNLEPVNSGPPYNRIEIDLSSSSAFDTGDTSQRNISIAGVFGYDNNTKVAGTLGAAITTTSETSITISDASLVGVGDLLICGTEAMVVTEKANLDSAQNLGSDMTASMAGTTVAVSTGTAYHAGETVQIDSEIMLIRSITGNNLTVKRAYDGTVLAAHTTGADIYVPRTLTVVRGCVGSTAATHLISAALTTQKFPGPVRSLCKALAIDTLLQEASGYSRTVGTDESLRNASGTALRNKKAEVRREYGRRLIKHLAV